MRHLPTARAAPGQACCSQPVSTMSPELPPLCSGPDPGLPRKLRFRRGVARQGGAGRLLPLRTRATPSWTRTHPHFPGPTETRLALQPNSRKADLYEYIQGPGILARLPHSQRSIIGGGCATAREAGALQVLITGVHESWDRARCQRSHLWGALMALLRQVLLEVGKPRSLGARPMGA